MIVKKIYRNIADLLMKNSSWRNLFIKYCTITSKKYEWVSEQCGDAVERCHNRFTIFVNKIINEQTLFCGISLSFSHSQLASSIHKHMDVNILLKFKTCDFSLPSQHFFFFFVSFFKVNIAIFCMPFLSFSFLRRNFFFLHFSIAKCMQYACEDSFTHSNMLEIFISYFSLNWIKKSEGSICWRFSRNFKWLDVSWSC